MTIDLDRLAALAKNPPPIAVTSDLRSLAFIAAADPSTVAALVAAVKAARTYEAAVESNSGKVDGGIALQVTYRGLRDALAPFRESA